MKNDSPLYVIERMNIATEAISYLSPGKVNWITPEIHEKYGTRYGKWTWGEAEDISSKLNHCHKGEYVIVPLPASKHP